MKTKTGHWAGLCTPSRPIMTRGLCRLPRARSLIGGAHRSEREGAEEDGGDDSDETVSTTAFTSSSRVD
jgi:hypothetical protein